MGVIVTVFLPLAVVVIMFSLGLGLSVGDFWRLKERPRAFLIGALNQIVLLPAVAYGIVLAWDITGATAVGIMILAACPGGAVSNIVTKFANWDLALSITLTAVFSLTCVLTIPLILGFAVQQFIETSVPDIDITGTAIRAFLLTALPIALGVAVRSLAPNVAHALEPAFARTATVLFVCVITAAVLSNWRLVTEHITDIGAALFCLIVILSTVGLIGSSMLGASANEARTIAVETSVQNSALGVTLAGLLVADSPGFNAFAIPSAIYAVIWLATALPLFLVFAKICPNRDP
ncbi:MAG: bile acid:sodium symporter [Rhodobacteraceae bacterium]|nr:bile acid:sodium symporter [Paracoccaceae bacterium]